ncbi:hypothetical protein HDV00_011859 [Rhizophlyctis rosea]|nr:hypothetical protein HDV00_011859 [Rhizophlyctis rosea]
MPHPSPEENSLSKNNLESLFGGVSRSTRRHQIPHEALRAFRKIRPPSPSRQDTPKSPNNTSQPPYYHIPGPIHSEPSKADPEKPDMLLYLQDSEVPKAAEKETNAPRFRASRIRSQGLWDMCSKPDHDNIPASFHSLSSPLPAEKTSSLAKEVAPPQYNSIDTAPRPLSPSFDFLESSVPITTSVQTYPSHIPANPEQLIDSMLAQWSFESSNTAKILATKDAQLAQKEVETGHLKAMLRELGLSGDVGSPGEDESTDKQEGSPGSLGVPPSSDSTIKTRWRNDDTSDYTSAYMSQLSFETSTSEEGKRWKEMLLKRCDDLEKANRELKRVVAQRDAEMRELRDKVKGGKGFDGGNGTFEADERGFTAWGRGDGSEAVRKSERHLKVSELSEDEQLQLALAASQGQLNIQSSKCSQPMDDDELGAENDSDEAMVGSEVGELEDDADNYKDDKTVTDEEEDFSQIKDQHRIRPIHLQQSSASLTFGPAHTQSDDDDELYTTISESEVKSYGSSMADWRDSEDEEWGF